MIDQQNILITIREIVVTTSQIDYGKRLLKMKKLMGTLLGDRRNFMEVHGVITIICNGDRDLSLSLAKSKSVIAGMKKRNNKNSTVRGQRN